MKITGFRNYLGWPQSSFGCDHKMLWEKPKRTFRPTQYMEGAGLRGLVMVLYIKEKGSLRWLLYLRKSKLGEKTVIQVCIYYIWDAWGFSERKCPKGSWACRCDAPGRGLVWAQKWKNSIQVTANVMGMKETAQTQPACTAAQVAHCPTPEVPVTLGHCGFIPLSWHFSGR